MEAPEVQQSSSSTNSRSQHLDAVREEIKYRKDEIGRTQHKHFGYAGPIIAADKLQAYRNNSRVMKSFSQATECLLQSPKPPEQLRTAAHANAIRTTTATAIATATNGGGEAFHHHQQQQQQQQQQASSGPYLHNKGFGMHPSADVMASMNTSNMMSSRASTNGSSNGHGVATSTPPINSSDAIPSRSEPGGDGFTELSKKNRSLAEANQTLESENARLKVDFEGLSHTVDVMTNENLNSGRNVAGFVDDLRLEKLNHEAAKRALEEKSRELENSALKMAELLEESTAVHERNVQLALKMQEMTSLRVEWEQEKEDMRQRLEDAEAHAAAAVAERRGGQGGGRDNEGDDSVRSEKGGEEEAETLLVKKELEQARAAVEFKTSQLEAVNARAAKNARELQQYKGKARSGLFMRLIKSVWSLARTTGFIAFLLLVYVAVSEDAFRSRGVDVYRLAH